MSRLEIGVLVTLTDRPAEALQQVAALGLGSCQVCSWDPNIWTDRTGDRLLAAREETGVTVTTFWAGYTGPAIWDFIEGPATIGLVPREYRPLRVEQLKRAAEFAARFKLPSITTHVGFLPEDPNDTLFTETVAALQEVAGRCAELGIEFWFETGQETPVTMLRTIERVDTGNLGINLDPANLIMYGKANPVDALDVFGRYVRGVHAKDGEYPTNGRQLGVEKPLGQGRVGFPALLGKLAELGYEGALTIEREISGPQQTEDIKRAIELLKGLC